LGNEDEHENDFHDEREEGASLNYARSLDSKGKKKRQVFLDPEEDHEEEYNPDEPLVSFGNRRQRAEHLEEENIDGSEKRTANDEDDAEDDYLAKMKMPDSFGWDEEAGEADGIDVSVRADKLEDGRDEGWGKHSEDDYRRGKRPGEQEVDIEEDTSPEARLGLSDISRISRPKRQEDQTRDEAEDMLEESGRPMADFLEEIRTKLEKRKSKIPPGTIDSLDKLKGVFQTQPAEPKILSSQPGDEDQVPQALAAPCPPGPSLKPLAFAFYMSEMMSSTSLTMLEIGTRFCTHLSASCGGLNAEIWTFDGNSWEPFISRTGEGKRYAEFLRDVPNLKEGEAKLYSGKAMLCHLKGSRKQRLACLLMSGDGVELVDKIYFEEVAECARGLVLDLVKDLDSSEPETGIDGEAAA